MARYGEYMKIPRPKTPMPDSDKFCDRLWWLMETRGDSVLKISRATGVTGKTIISYRAGHTDPLVRVVLALADYYGVTTDFLLGRTRSPNGYGRPI